MEGRWTDVRGSDSVRRSGLGAAGGTQNEQAELREFRDAQTEAGPTTKKETMEDRERC